MKKMGITKQPDWGSTELIPRDQPLAVGNVLDREALLGPYKDVGVVVVDRRTLPFDDAFLAARLPKIGASARARLAAQLESFEEGEINPRSIRQQPSGLTSDNPDLEALRKQVIITRDSVLQKSVWYEGEELFPVRLLPNDGGLECRSGLASLFCAVPDEAVRAARERLARLAHCRQLLTDLPIALQNSEAAQLAHSKSKEVDLNTLGAMYVEQQRIKQEIDDQTAQLAHLERAVEHDREPGRLLKRYRQETTLLLPIGASRLGDSVYTVMLIPSGPPATPHTTATTCEDRSQNTTQWVIGRGPVRKVTV